MGRIDDVMNVSGHRIGTMEVESALVSHPSVAEAAVVGRPDDLKGTAIVAFVTPRAGTTAGRRRCARRCASTWRQQIGAIARPDGDPLHRRAAEDALRQDHAAPAARHRDRRARHVGDTTTLEDYSVLARLREADEG